MAWPPPVLPINRTNADPQQNTHPADHNVVALAINDIVAVMPRGHIAYTPLVTPPDVGATPVNLMTTTFTLPTARWIRVSANIAFTQITGPSNTQSATIFINGAASTRIWNGPGVLNQVYVAPGFGFLKCPAGTNTAYLQVASAAGAMRVGALGQTFLHVEDIGP